MPILVVVHDQGKIAFVFLQLAKLIDYMFKVNIKSNTEKREQLGIIVESVFHSLK